MTPSSCQAEVEQAEAGDDSALHVIVFDEIDAFTRERGSLSGDTSGIRDSVVNQLLAKMDGVEQLDNILGAPPPLPPLPPLVATPCLCSHLSPLQSSA